MLAPGFETNPTYKVLLSPLRSRVEIFMDGEKVVETRRALRMDEDKYGPVLYIPEDDISDDVVLIKRRDYHCPYKGTATIYDVKHGSRRYEEAAWSYDRPYDEFTDLKDHVAFHSQKVQFIRVTG